jgi:hypothetical protein
VVEAVAPVRQTRPRVERWLHPILVALGAGTFLYATLFPLVDSPGVRLIVFWTLDSRLLTELIAIFVSLMAFSVAVRLVIARGGATGVARGVLRSTGLVGVALVVHEAGGLIDLKGGIPAAGAVLGFAGASMILVASLLGGKGGFEDGPLRPPGSLRLVGPIAILLGAALFTLALLMPWTTRPFPLRLVNLPTGLYWTWSIVVPSAIVIPVIVAAVRMLPGLHQRQTGVGIALAGGIFATLLFVRVIGHVLSSALPPFPPVFSLEIGAYIGLAAGSLIVVGTVFHAFVLRH